MGKFITEKNIFGNEIFYEDDSGKYRVCNIMQLEEQKQLEIQTPFFKSKLQPEPILLEIELQKNREVEMIYHNVNINENTFIFKNFYNFKEIKTGKTLPQVAKFFIGKDKKRYLEAFSTCRFGNQTIYYFVRKTKEAERDELGAVIDGAYKDIFLIGAYLYDPKADEEGLFPPLQLLYCTKVDFYDLKLASLDED